MKKNLETQKKLELHQEKRNQLLLDIEEKNKEKLRNTINKMNQMINSKKKIDKLKSKNFKEKMKEEKQKLLKVYSNKNAINEQLNQRREDIINKEHIKINRALSLTDFFNSEMNKFKYFIYFIIIEMKEFRIILIELMN